MMNSRFFHVMAGWAGRVDEDCSSVEFGGQALLIASGGTNTGKAGQREGGQVFGGGRWGGGRFGINLEVPSPSSPVRSDFAVVSVPPVPNRHC